MAWWSKQGCLLSLREPSTSGGRDWPDTINHKHEIIPYVREETGFSDSKYGEGGGRDVFGSDGQESLFWKIDKFKAGTRGIRTNKSNEPEGEVKEEEGLVLAWVMQEIAGAFEKLKAGTEG